jgi:hypothetical protein
VLGCFLKDGQCLPKAQTILEIVIEAFPGKVWLSSLCGEGGSRARLCGEVSRDLSPVYRVELEDAAGIRG